MNTKKQFIINNGSRAWFFALILLVINFPSVFAAGAAYKGSLENFCAYYVNHDECMDQVHPSAAAIKPKNTTLETSKMSVDWRVGGN